MNGVRVCGRVTVFTEGVRVGMTAPGGPQGDRGQEGGQGCQWGTGSAEAGALGGRERRGQGGTQAP